MQNYPLNLLQSMLKIYSPSGSEGELAELISREMSTRDFNVKKDPAGNVIGKLGRDGPRILLCGHMDTVSGDIPVRIEGDFLYGRGSVDAKSSLAAMIAGSSLAFERTSVPFRVIVAGVVEEETTSAGAKALINSGLECDLGVFGEPSGVSNIIIGYKGSLQLHITCITAGGHSASPWLSKSSYEEAYEFWKAFSNTLLQNESPSKFSATTGCVTHAIAGDATNKIPSQANLVIDVRIPPGIKAAEMIKKIERFVKDYQKDLENVRFLVKIKDPTEAYVGPDDSIVVSAFRLAIRKTMGCSAQMVKKTGTSDMNLFAESYSIPMIAYGPGDSSLDHTENERVSIADYVNSVEVYASAIQRIASLAQNKVLPAQASD